MGRQKARPSLLEEIPPKALFLFSLFSSILTVALKIGIKSSLSLRSPLCANVKRLCLLNFFLAMVKVKVKSLSHVRLFATPWTVAHQAPPSMEFSRQEYWSRLPFPSPGDLPLEGED